MFYNCLSIISLPDLSKWNIKNNYIDEMFDNCLTLLSLPVKSKSNNKSSSNSLIDKIMNLCEMRIRNLNFENEDYI